MIELLYFLKSFSNISFATELPKLVLTTWAESPSTTVTNTVENDLSQVRSPTGMCKLQLSMFLK